MRLRPLVRTVALSLVSLFFMVSRADAEGVEPTSEPGALVLHRLELQPHVGWAATPESVTGAFVGVDASFRFSPLFALGVDADWYAPFNGSGGSHPTYPLNETRDSGSLDAFVYLWPARATSVSPLGELEVYLLGGAGFVQTRPVSVVDPAIRAFDDNTLVDLNVGVGARLFATDRLAIVLELRDLLYFDKVENPVVAIGPGAPGNTLSPTNPDTWYSPDTRFTNAVQLRLGGSFFL
jgi:hypothetical protein